MQYHLELVRRMSISTPLLHIHLGSIFTQPSKLRGKFRSSLQEMPSLLRIAAPALGALAFAVHSLSRGTTQQVCPCYATNRTCLVVAAAAAGVVLVVAIAVAVRKLWGRRHGQYRSPFFPTAPPPRPPPPPPSMSHSADDSYGQSPKTP